MDVDTADKSVNFFPHISLCLKFPFLIGADHEINYSCPYLVFKMAALCKPAATIITGSIQLGIMILVSKYTFSGSRNSLALFTIVSEDCFQVKREKKDSRISYNFSEVARPSPETRNEC